jgi:multiple antibiotic resistance protein
MLFLIMDPFGNMPVFNSVLKEVPEGRRTRIIARESTIALGILIVFLWAGQPIMNFLNLRQPTLSISGGIILFIIALRMLFPRQEVEIEYTREEPLIVPLAMPLIAGPSCVAVLLLLASSEPQRMLDWTLALLASWSATAAILILSPLLLKLLTRRGIKALERLMGMILIMVSVQMLLDGVASYLGLERPR